MRAKKAGPKISLQLAALQRLALAASGVGERDALLDQLYQEIQRLLAPDGVIVTLCRSELEQIELALLVEKGKPLAELTGQCFPLEESGLHAWIIEQGQAVLIENLATEKPPVEPLFFSGRTPASWLEVPLRAQDQVLGTVALYAFTPHAFDEATRALLETLVAQVALALHNDRLENTVRQRSAEIDALHYASLQLTSSVELKAVLDAIVAATLALIDGVQDSHIFLYDEEEDRLRFGAALWADGRASSTFTEPRKNGFTHTVAHKGEAIIVPDMHKHPLFSNTSWNGAIIGIPLKVRRRVVGVMNVAYSRPRSIRKSDLHLLRLLASQAAIAITNAQSIAAQAEQERIRLENDFLERHAEELAELNASKDKFFSIISHDLRSPFTSVLGFAKHMMRQADTLTPEEIQQYSEMIYRSGKQVLDLLENLLQWSRVQTGRMEFQPTAVGLEELVERNMALVGSQAAAKEISLVVASDPTIKLYVDPNMMDTVLRNLLSNAIKFTPNKGRVSINVVAGERMAEVTVTDTGVGISKEDMPKLFRIDEAHSTRGTANERGTGLGLILCKDLVEKNGGTIRVRSTPGQGTTFAFTMPLLTAESLAALGEVASA